MIHYGYQLLTDDNASVIDRVVLVVRCGIASVRGGGDGSGEVVVVVVEWWWWWR